ncbi:uncharacterized protein LOC133839169 [Drosophila sulfurigaster albostrigata]|uniref:uncharacterized protein LOC133839169 n=1 Tax=Drosophila sulfurigaster albostrigata TaxID=89887 RepID=UPI002D21E67D|nr:uncharacterized protein LOC133839169 [Drosophila sulfurigaster albostrigata]
MPNAQSDRDALEAVYELTQGATAQRNWRKLLTLGDTFDVQLKRKLLWIWPTAKNLMQFQLKLNELRIQHVLSIGCGNGLLEWLLTAVGTENSLRVYGLERDANWWRSKYAIRSFIPLNYIESSEYNCQLSGDFLKQCCCGLPPQALLFCYFNNRVAFLEYLSAFAGCWLIIIGPQPSLGIHTDPNPLQPELPDCSRWALHSLINWTEHNVVALYKKLP